MRALRAKPWLALATVIGILLVAAWIGWAIYVGADRDATEGLGVLIAWPALLLFAILVSLPIVGVFLWIRRAVGSSAVDRPETQGADEAEATETG